MVSIYVEVEPLRNPEKFKRVLDTIKKLKRVRGVDIPDAPLGKPRVLAIALGHLAKEHGVDCIVHLRLRDFNVVGFKQIIWAAYVLGVDKLLLLRGDAPQEGQDVDQVTSEYALSYIRSEQRLNAFIKPGIYLSLRYPIEKVLDRVYRTKASFYVINWFDPERHQRVIDAIHDVNAEAIPYIILAPSGDIERIRAMLGGQQVLELEKLDTILARYEHPDAVILSAPTNLDKLLKFMVEHGY